jgi:hypothetical protein
MATALTAGANMRPISNRERGFDSTGIETERPWSPSFAVLFAGLLCAESPLCLRPVAIPVAPRRGGRSALVHG